MSSIRQIRPQDKPRPWDVHPIWRGMGCVMMVLIPIVSYAGASLLIESGFFYTIGVNLTADFTDPRPINPVPGILPIIPERYVPHLYGNLVIGALLTLLGFGLLMIFYIIMYRLMGPPMKGPMDADPVRRPPKRSQAKRR